MCNPDQFCDSDKLESKWMTRDGIEFSYLECCSECGRVYQKRRVFTDGADADIFMLEEVKNARFTMPLYG